MNAKAWFYGQSFNGRVEVQEEQPTRREQLMAELNSLQIVMAGSAAFMNDGELAMLIARYREIVK